MPAAPTPAIAEVRSSMRQPLFLKTVELPSTTHHQLVQELGDDSRSANPQATFGFGKLSRVRPLSGRDFGKLRTARRASARHLLIG